MARVSPGNTWVVRHTLRAAVEPAQEAVYNLYFGFALALTPDGRTLVVGSPGGHHNDETNNPLGSVHVFGADGEPAGEATVWSARYRWGG